jgi:selenocysteine lyase/cysteine desulfurase
VTHIFGTTAKIAYLYWQKYEYTLDEKWLRERAYPMVKGAVECYRNFPNMTLDADGKYHIHHTNSNEPAWGVRDSDEDMSALHGLLRPGDHVVTSVCEHNSVLRPLRFLAERGVTTTYVPCDGQGYVDPDSVRQAISSKTRLIALVHASNVTGAIQPVEAVGRIAGDHGVLFLVDAAQSLGYVPIDVAAMGCQLLAAPGHKGLLGPLGMGVLYLAPGIEQHLAPLRQGGTGTRSDEDRQPETVPDRYESGNLNVPGIVGLEAGASHVTQVSPQRIQAHGGALTKRLLTGLARLPGVWLYGPRSADNRVGVVSLNIAGYDPQELAALLDAQWSIQTRAGLHCAPACMRPWIHCRAAPCA